MSVKRLNYFTHQFLREQDFKDEQAYHLQMRHRHNQLVYGWGIVEGFHVRKKGEREITIEPGIAIDKDGKEIIVSSTVTRDLGSFERSSHTFVTVAYGESMEESDHHSAGGVEGYTRVTESPVFNETRHQPEKDGAVITLARVHLNEVGHVHHIETDSSVRKIAGVRNPSVGWMRLPFKPVRMSHEKMTVGPVKFVNQQEHEFIVEGAFARCDERGASGSMDIPVPPAASKLVAFRIAGTTSGRVFVHLLRVGWNLHENKAEQTQLLDEIVSGPSFHKEIPAAYPLDETHALAVTVRAEGESYICLVAAKFE
jgi:hypothetical protein